MCVEGKSIVAIKMASGDCNLSAISRNLASEHARNRLRLVIARLDVSFVLTNSVLSGLPRKFEEENQVRKSMQDRSRHFRHAAWSLPRPFITSTSTLSMPL